MKTRSSYRQKPAAKSDKLPASPPDRDAMIDGAPLRARRKLDDIAKDLAAVRSALDKLADDRARELRNSARRRH